MRGGERPALNEWKGGEERVKGKAREIKGPAQGISRREGEERREGR